MFQITSKATLYKWRQTRGLPNPVTLMPLRWLRSAVEYWKDSVGGREAVIGTLFGKLSLCDRRNPTMNWKCQALRITP